MDRIKLYLKVIGLCFIVMLLISSILKTLTWRDKAISNYNKILVLEDSIATLNYNIVNDTTEIVLLRRCEEKDMLIDSLNNELQVSNFKLERIRYYNSIAKNNNNIKYLRGWINRVLEN